MQKRRLGQTELTVSALGLGTVKFGRNTGVNYPKNFTLPTDEDIEKLLTLASELGINLLDTAPAYGSSEERLGKILKGMRQHFLISTKVGEEFLAGQSHFDFSQKGMLKSIERSLKRLQTDYLDIVLVHSNGDDERLIEQENIFATLAHLKQSGKIRAYGMSTKTVRGGMLTIEHADLAMITFNPTYELEREVITKAKELQKGIFIKKAFASGHLDKIREQKEQRLSSQGNDHGESITTSFRFIFAEPGVSSVILGTINPDHLQQNVQLAKEVLESPVKRKPLVIRQIV